MPGIAICMLWKDENGEVYPESDREYTVTFCKKAKNLEQARKGEENEQIKVLMFISFDDIEESSNQEDSPQLLIFASLLDWLRKENRESDSIYKVLNEILNAGITWGRPRENRD